MAAEEAAAFSGNCLHAACNSTWINTGDLASLAFLYHLSAVDLGLVIATLVLAVCSNAIFAGTVIFVYKKSHSGSYVELSATLLALYPVYETLSVIAMGVPRALQFMSVLIGAYTLMVFNDFCSMVVVSCGGMQRFVQKMDGQPIAVPKCCACLPRRSCNKKRIFVVRSLIRQGKVTQYFHVMIAAILLLNGNYALRPMAADQPLFWVNALVSISRIIATMSMVWFIRSVVPVLTGSSLGKKFIAMQLINIVHLLQEVIFGILQTRDLPLQPYGFITVENRLGLYRYFSLSVLTLACQLWSVYLFYKSPVPAALLRSQAAPQAEAETDCSSGSASNQASHEEAVRERPNRAV